MWYSPSHITLFAFLFEVVSTEAQYLEQEEEEEDELRLPTSSINLISYTIVLYLDSTRFIITSYYY